MRFYLLANNGYTTQDYPEPEEWVRPIERAGLKLLEFYADHMEPLLARRVIESRSEYFQATVRALEKAGATVVSVGTGRVSYMQNLFSHPFADMREEGFRWLGALVELAAALGAKYLSGHYDYIPIRTLERMGKGAQRLVVDGMLRFSELAARKGIEGIFLEQMYLPTLKPYTIREAEEIYGELRESSAVPVMPQFDLGHMTSAPRDDCAHGGRDKDVCEWLSNSFGSPKVLVHCQQTENGASRHWPFTRATRETGIIDATSVIEALMRSGAEEVLLSMEVQYPRLTPIGVIEADVRETVEAFDSVLRAGGFQRQGGAYVGG